jgi:hypothetical protein
VIGKGKDILKSLSKLIDIFKKQQGFRLVKNYIKFGVFFQSILLVLILGFSKTSLEIFRLGMQNKIQKKLRKKFKKQISFIKQNSNNAKQSVEETEQFVWICWFQGIENAPRIVKSCIRSVNKLFHNRNVVVINKDNFKEYVNIPEVIIQKWELGKITNAHFSDILRAFLLYRYGGLWIDSTVLCTSPDIPDYIDDDLFFYQILKPGKDGHAIFASSWLISAKPNNPIIGMTKSLLVTYWEKYNYLVDYFLFHHFLCISCLEYPDLYQNIRKMDNSNPHILLLEIKNKYNDAEFERVKSISDFHKLTYKIENDECMKDSYIEYIKSNY